MKIDRFHVSKDTTIKDDYGSWCKTEDVLNLEIKLDRTESYNTDLQKYVQYLQRTIHEKEKNPCNDLKKYYLGLKEKFIVKDEKLDYMINRIVECIDYLNGRIKTD